MGLVLSLRLLKELCILFELLKVTLSLNYSVILSSLLGKDLSYFSFGVCFRVCFLYHLLDFYMYFFFKQFGVTNCSKERPSSIVTGL